MTPLVVVQARMGSTRLPGKVLEPVGDRTLIDLMFDRLAAGGITPVVATSTRPGDDALAAWARHRGVRCVRGPEADVLARVRAVLERHAGDPIVRLTADCPLIDPALVGVATELLVRTGADYVGNTLRRSFPDGLDVEVVRREVLMTAAAAADAPADREHVTRWIIGRPDRFSLLNLSSGRPLAAERWTVDTAEDLRRVREIVDRLDDPVHADWQLILDRAGRTAADRVDVVQPRADDIVIDTHQEHLHA